MSHLDTGGSASRFDGQAWTTYRASNTIHAVAVAPNGAVWCATRAIDAQVPEQFAGGGVSRFDGQHGTTYTTADGLPTDFDGHRAGARRGGMARYAERVGR